MEIINKIALALVIVGAINWGLVGFFDYNLVSSLFGEATSISRLVYCLVGLAGLWVAISTIMSYF